LLGCGTGDDDDEKEEKDQATPSAAKEAVKVCHPCRHLVVERRWTWRGGK
jgi:hypothetical protein